jgi:hypothetical protein
MGSFCRDDTGLHLLRGVKSDEWRSITLLVCKLFSTGKTDQERWNLLVNKDTKKRLSEVRTQFIFCEIIFFLNFISFARLRKNYAMENEIGWKFWKDC